MKKILILIPLMAIPVLLCGARAPQKRVTIVLPPPVEAEATPEPVNIPGCKAVEFVEKALHEQAERYPGIDLSALTDAEREIVTYLLDRDVSLEAACGILANINRETGGTYDPCITNASGAIGLCQWLGPRKAELMQREECCTVQGQLDFLLHELETTESGTDLTGSAYDCGYNFARDFERTGLKGTYTDRAALAEEYYKEITQ